MSLEAQCSALLSDDPKAQMESTVNLRKILAIGTISISLSLSLSLSIVYEGTHHLNDHCHSVLHQRANTCIYVRSFVQMAHHRSQRHSLVPSFRSCVTSSHEPIDLSCSSKPRGLSPTSVP